MLKIGEISHRLNITPRTLRYYEQLGLIQPDKISAAGYRFYSPDLIPVIKRIRELQAVGLTLQEIRKVIGLYAQPSRKIEAKQMILKYIEDHLHAVDQKIGVLSKMRKELIHQKTMTQKRLRNIAREKKL